MDYNFKEIEQRWQEKWKADRLYAVSNEDNRPKFYVLDMFPYPSGAGLHVGHPLGYIASDIYARYKRLCGFNVLHPMGFDAYGLPAEQYAIQTGQHPEVTTNQNIARYKEQLGKIGFCYDWEREVRTCDPKYYHWTQWAFKRMFEHYYDEAEQKAKPIAELVARFEAENTDGWNALTETEKQQRLMNYRIAYLADTKVNWCEKLGTVLANDEVSEGLSVRGGYPVEQRIMRQWSLRVSAYAERLLNGLDHLDWTPSLKETQRNWIGRSEGAEIIFTTSPNPSQGGETPFYYTDKTGNYPLLLQHAKRNRENPTEAEAILWKHLRAKQLGVKFRQQHPIAGYIPDFVCLEKRLIIEIDGGYHLENEQQEADALCTEWLNKNGFSVIRFTNEQVLFDIDNTLNTIKQALAEVSPLPWEEGLGVKVFTTRCDTVFGVTFMVLAPESEYVTALTTAEHKDEVEAYLKWVKTRTERDRIADRKVTGVFTGSYATNPLTKENIPIYVSDYVLSGYGTGAIMAVPAHDSRDYAFAKHFNLPIIPLIEGADVSENSFDAKEGVMMNSGFLNGLQVKDAIKTMKQYIENEGIGKVKVNFRLRDAIFSRQRYWGEPFPVYYKNGMPYMLPDEALPLELPEVDDFKPKFAGQPPLANAEVWAWDEANQKVVSKSLIDEKTVFPIECCTMPGFAGSSAYAVRYMDNHNDNQLVSKQANDYWKQVDLYIGGTEHATGHLIYSRFWNNFLYDLGVVCCPEPFQKLINQGMIQGRSNFVYRVTSPNPSQGGENHQVFVSLGQKDKYETQPIHCNVNIVSNDILDLDAFRNWLPEYKDAEFILEDGSINKPNTPPSEGTGEVYRCGWAIEKMSKSMWNVVNPDDIVERYGADTLRLYEMFLGPLEVSKPWDTNGIEGVHRFLKRLWNLFENITDDEPTREELRVLHRTIKKVKYDIENFSFNTAIPAFMTCQNDLQALKCSKRAVLEPLTITLASFAPHLAEEMWHRLGHETSVCDAVFPEVEEQYLVEDSVKYPISFNGKTRFFMDFPKAATKEEIEAAVLASEDAAKYLNGGAPKKVIVVQGRIVNVVI